MESLDGFPLADSAMIIVMGPTGSGKSSFISLLSDEHVEISHSLHSHTISTRPYRMREKVNGKTVFLVDTPGFDDTTRSDAEILKEITFFLMMLHERDVPLAGIVYMHRISDPRMSGSATKNLRLFKALCGEQNYQHVVLASTMWSHDEEKKAAERARLEDLRQLFWSDLIRGGSSLKKHRGDRASAIEIVRKLASRDLSPRRPITLAIQRELRVEGNTLANTAAGKLLAQEILGERERMERQADELRVSLEEAERSNDPETAEAIRDEQQVISNRVAGRVRDAEGLEVQADQLADEQGARLRQAIATTLEGQVNDEHGVSPPSSPRSPRDNRIHRRKSAAVEHRRSKRPTSKTHRSHSKSPDPWARDPRKMKGKRETSVQKRESSAPISIWMLSYMVESRPIPKLASSAAEWRD